MYKYATMNAIAPVGLARFSNEYVKEENYENADVLLVRSANLHEVDVPENVLAIARAGAGVNNIPLDKMAEQGTVVFNTPGANANGVKEMVFAGMLLAARDIVGGLEWVTGQTDNPNVAKDTEKAKKQFAGTELSGKKLGIIGLGAIGVLVANAATHLGMDVYGYDPYISVSAAWNLSRSVHHVNDVNEIYKNCDYITVHVPALESTKGMISAQAIAMMKPTTVVLNFARDVLVDEIAILKALDEGKLRKYVSDFPNATTVGHRDVILSPHIAASTSESEDNCAKMAVEELRDYVENGNIRNSVNYPTCQMGVCAAASRVAILHRNAKQMITRFTAAFSDTNIENMSNTSRGEYAYTMLDLATPFTEEALETLKKIDGVLRVRVIK